MKLTVKVRRAEPYATEDGKKPYDEWLRKLKDLKGSQERDIAKAKEYWMNYLGRKT